MLIHCCISLDFLYELYYDARIHEHQINISAYIFTIETGSITVFGYNNIKCYIIKENSPSKHYFNVAIVDYSYMFRLLQSNQHQTLHQDSNKLTNQMQQFHKFIT
jgi:hypothetical protein